MTESVLIGAYDEYGTVLWDEEVEIVHSALRLARSDDKEENAIARALCKCEKQEDTLGSFLGAVLREQEEAAQGPIGFFWDGKEGTTFIGNGTRANQELEALKELQKLLEFGGWLAEFLRVHLGWYLKHDSTPLEVMAHLVEEAANFESDVQHAKDITSRYPKMFAAEPVQANAKAAGDSNA